MPNPNDGGFWTRLERTDRRILAFFLLLAVLILAPIITLGILSWAGDLFSFVTSILGGLLGAFSITGALAFVHYHKKAIIPTSKVLLWFAVCAFVFSAVASVAIYVLDVDSSAFFPFAVTSPGVYNALWQFFVLFLLALFVLVAEMSEAFGLIWMLAIVEKRAVSDLLADIAKITANTSDFRPTQGRLASGRYAALQWLFNIPNVLDTRLLTIDRDEPGKRFPWKALRLAWLWASLLGFILTILVVHYAKSLAQISIENLLAISGLISMMTPLLVLSWFIFRRLDARIKGPVADFKLYNGLKSRTTNAVVTVGTLIIFIRLVLEKTDFPQLLWLFANYYPVFLVSATIFIFIYFNYFESDVARNIVNRGRMVEECVGQ